MANEPLTAEEQAWANANADAIRSMMTQSARDAAEPSIKPADANPIAAAAHDLLKSMTMLGSKIRKSKERAEVSLARYNKIAAGKTMRPDDQEYQQLIAEEIADLDAKVEKMARHQAAIQRKIETLTANPEGLFLPLGAVVRFIGVPDHENSLGISDDRDNYPVAGSIGVVTGLLREGEFSIGVSMREPFQIGSGERYRPSCDGFPTYYVEREMLEVEEYAKLPDGAEYQGYSFQPTHRATSENRKKEDLEMVLEARGYFWRFHDFGGKQGIEVLQAFESMDEMSWIDGPLDEYQKSETSAGQTMRP
jgi:hypothetical protein